MGRLKRTSRLKSNPSRPRSTRASTLLVDLAWEWPCARHDASSEAELVRAVCAPTPNPPKRRGGVVGPFRAAEGSGRIRRPPPLFGLSLVVLNFRVAGRAYARVPVCSVGM